MKTEFFKIFQSLLSDRERSENCILLGVVDMDGTLFHIFREEKLGKLEKHLSN